ncbi:MAG: hypothetical protein DME82_02050 [Verrucomicrobia bacterium]|nr:MAG: hypothetical protein DME82_02050 [Verrucomicrobiota bacterium]
MPGPLHRIAPESFLVAGCELSGHNQQRKAQMKTILMLIVGLMLADCGSMENVRNAPPVLRDRGDTIAVGVICACP